MSRSTISAVSISESPLQCDTRLHTMRHKYLAPCSAAHEPKLLNSLAYQWPRHEREDGRSILWTFEVWKFVRSSSKVRGAPRQACDVCCDPEGVCIPPAGRVALCKKQACIGKARQGPQQQQVHG